MGLVLFARFCLHPQKPLAPLDDFPLSHLLAPRALRRRLGYAADDGFLPADQFR
jgi:hypothetical protein